MMSISQVDEQSLQQWMVERVARELDITTSTVDPDCELMNLGVDSLALIGLTGELAELLDRDLPAEMMWELGSIRAISRHIAGLAGDASTTAFVESTTSNSYFAGASAWSPIRALQPNGDRPPLFLIHGLGGGTTNYRLLLKYVDEEQPVFGLDESPDPPGTIEEMAQMLVDGLRTVQRKGPYRLLGFCFGAVVAYEVARQLFERGDEVSFLGMVDAPSPARFPRLNVQDKLVWPAVSTASLAASLRHRVRAAAKDPKKMIGGARGRAARWHHRVRKLFRLTDQPVSDYWVSKFWEGHQDIVRHNTSALFAYTPQHYPGHLRLYLSEEQHRMERAVAWRWQKLAAQGAEMVRMPGIHTEMLNERSAEFIARQFDQVDHTKELP